MQGQALLGCICKRKASNISLVSMLQNHYLKNWMRQALTKHQDACIWAKVLINFQRIWKISLISQHALDVGSADTFLQLAWKTVMQRSKLVAIWSMESGRYTGNLVKKRDTETKLKRWYQMVSLSLSISMNGHVVRKVSLKAYGEKWEPSVSC